MRSKQSPPLRLSALVQYITQTQQSYERALAGAESGEERRELHLEHQVSQWEIESARKYKLTPSALIMIARLMPERSQGIIQTLPGTGIWAMLDDPQGTNVYFSSIPLAFSSYLDLHPSVRLSDEQARVAARDWEWTLEVMAQGSPPRSYLYHAKRQQWTLNAVDVCPAGRCEFTLRDQVDHFPNWYICDECMPIFRYWTSWFPVALMAINGDFAETEERREPPPFIERERRKVRRPGRVGAEEILVTHTYHVVTFNISVKKQANLPHSDLDSPSNPTWLERAIEAGTVLYVSKHIGPTQRTFSHERYVNMRGKTIDVRPFDKRIPMSVERLKQTIYQVIASG